jgi:hypothetical protein
LNRYSVYIAVPEPLIAHLLKATSAQHPSAAAAAAAAAAAHDTNMHNVVSDSAELPHVPSQ